MPIPPILNIATPTIHHDKSWYMDLGTNHHLISDQNNLSNAIPYLGHEQVKGKSISISHVENSLNQFGTLILNLNNILHVPNLTKNLITTKQLCVDNSV